MSSAHHFSRHARHESSIQAIGNDAPAKAANTDKSAVSALFVLLPAGPKEPLQVFGARCTVELSLHRLSPHLIGHSISEPTVTAPDSVGNIHVNRKSGE
jgi:hypothetical protein